MYESIFNTESLKLAENTESEVHLNGDAKKRMDHMTPSGLKWTKWLKSAEVISNLHLYKGCLGTWLSFSVSFLILPLGAKVRNVQIIPVREFKMGSLGVRITDGFSFYPLKLLSVLCHVWCLFWKISTKTDAKWEKKNPIQTIPFSC